MTDHTPLSGWSHAPRTPILISPLFRWPWRGGEILRWFIGSWFLISEKLIILGVAFVTLTWFQPPLEQTATLEPGWVLGLWLRNLALFSAVAGGLHLWLYGWRRQGDRLRYDARPLGRGRKFTLGGQVADNVVWSLASGVTVWTGYEALVFWAMANGFAPVLSFAENPVWFVALFLLIPLWESFYFYWIHRFLHWPPLYRAVHAVHHRNTNVGPWSGLSMHPVEHVIYLGSVLIHLLVPGGVVHVLFHMQYLTLTAATTHCGFEGLLVRDKNRLRLGTFHHQLHHRYFECNYGSLEIPWDAAFGSFHDGTTEGHAAMAARRKGMRG